MRVYKTITNGLSRTRYLRCTLCDETGKEILRVDHLGRPLLFLDVATRAGNETTTVLGQAWDDTGTDKTTP